MQYAVHDPKDLKSKISERLKLARTEAGFTTAKEFAEKQGLKISTYSLHEANTRSMSVDVIEHYATLLEINSAWLLTGTGPKSLFKIRKMPIIEWHEVLLYPQAIDLTTKAWTLSDMDLHPDSFALVVNNDSMEPRYPEGTIIIVDKSQKPQNKDFALIYLKDKNCIIFKQIIYLDGEVYARGLNPSYQTLSLSQDATIIGKVVQAKLIV